MGSKRKRGPRDVLVNSQPAQKRVKQKSEVANGPSMQQQSNKGSKVLDRSPFCERPAGDERKREARLYELLGSEDADDRISAADAIISGLLGEEAVAESVLHRHLANRLFRGLASGRNASRLGFSLVLTELLSQLFGKQDVAGSRYPDLTFDKVLQTLVEKTQPNGSLPGKEERDHYFGQLFGIECFVRANILFRDKTRWLLVLDLLLKLSEKKVWLRPQCGWVIVEAVRQMKPKLAGATLQKLADKGHGQTPEGVGIWIAAMDRFGDDLKLPSKPWSDPLAAKSLPDLTQSLKDSGRDTSQDAQHAVGKPKQNNWTAQLHWVWDILLEHFKSLDATVPSPAADFEQFWNRVVDDSFFSKTASDHQKFSGFMIFQKMLEDGATCPFIVDKIFSKNLMVCLMNQAAREDRFLHRAALKALKAIEATARKEPSIIKTVLTHLLGKNGIYNFDQRTNTKTVEKVLQSTASSDGAAVIGLLKSTNTLEAPQSVQVFASYLFKLASLPADSPVTDDAGQPSVAGLALQELAKMTYAKQDPESSAGNVRSMLQNRLSSAFAKFVRRREDFSQFCNAVLLIEADIGNDEEIQAEYVQALERLRDLLDTSGIEQELVAPYQGLALLHAVGLLQLYNEEPDALETLADLEQCYDKLKRRDAEDETGIAEFLVEILLSMVARQSSLMRQVSQQVFEAFTHIMSEEALRLLTDPLTAEESERGQQALFSTEDEDLAGEDESDEDEEGGDDESLDSDVEIVDLEDADSDAGMDDASHASDGESEAEQDDAEADAADGDLEALDDALAAVLKSHRLDKDDEAESEDDDSDMSDSEMMELDSKLVEIFKQRAKGSSKKKDKKDAKQSVVDFKHRILDLLAIFVKKEVATYNTLAFKTLIPLLELIRTTKAKPLANKACGIVLDFSKTLKKARKDSEASDVDVDLQAILRVLEGVHAEAVKDVSHTFAKAASAASLSCAWTVCFSTSVNRVDDVFRLYHNTQLSWFKGEAKIRPSFFVEWINWCQSHASKAATQTDA
ncbi:DNA polymerase V [Coniochaeta hoffmannii]|uniref:DNA polymerase V n=1 Tax=Coniochaeta hoffmannii TaxID=91930 RepID=A0AA38VN62_9PEZI|nr:DNA polymerase V [Coniochaeta hoffmannii]